VLFKNSRLVVLALFCVRSTITLLFILWRCPWRSFMHAVGFWRTIPAPDTKPWATKRSQKKNTNNRFWIMYAFDLFFVWLSFCLRSSKRSIKAFVGCLDWFSWWWRRLVVLKRQKTNKVRHRGVESQAIASGGVYKASLAVLRRFIWVSELFASLGLFWYCLSGLIFWVVLAMGRALLAMGILDALTLVEKILAFWTGGLCRESWAITMPYGCCVLPCWCVEAGGPSFCPVLFIWWGTTVWQNNEYEGSCFFVSALLVWVERHRSLLFRLPVFGEAILMTSHHSPSPHRPRTFQTSARKITSAFLFVNCGWPLWRLERIESVASKWRVIIFFFAPQGAIWGSGSQKWAPALLPGSQQRPD